jgi:group I intron endonuclease
MIIYRIKSKINNKCYIGVCKNFYIRKRTHLQHLNKNNHHSIKLQRAWNKYGSDNFIFEILESDIDENVIFKKEIEFIKNYNTFKTGYNCTIGGEGTLGRFGSKHHNSKYYHIYNIHGDYVTKKLMLKGIQDFTGKTFRISNKGFSISGEYVITKKYEGKKFTKHHKIFKYNLNGDMVNSYLSTSFIKDFDIDDVYKSIRTNTAINGIFWKTNRTEQQKKQFNNYKVKIGMYTKEGIFEQSFESVTDAYDFLSIPINGNISKCLKNKQKTAYGHIWLFDK